MVWTDDDLWYIREDRLATHPNLFTIMPETQNGLTPDDCFAIMAFLEENKYNEKNNTL